MLIDNANVMLLSKVSGYSRVCLFAQGTCNGDLGVTTGYVDLVTGARMLWSCSEVPVRGAMFIWDAVSLLESEHHT